MTTTTTPWVRARPVRGERGVYRSRSAARARRRARRTSAGDIARDVLAATVFALAMMTIIVVMYLGGAVVFL
jgi:hypothetical protein